MSNFTLTCKARRCLGIALGLCSLGFVCGILVWRADTEELHINLYHYMPRLRRIFESIPKEQPLGVSTGDFPSGRVIDLQHLESFVRTPIFTYSKRVIKAQHYDGQRAELTRVNDVLTPSVIKLEKGNLSAVTVPDMPPLTLRVPHSPKMDTSIFSFGMATTIPRLIDSIPGISHWLPNSNAQLHILAPAHDDSPILEFQMRSIGMNVSITTDSTPFAQRYFSLIKKLYDERGPKTKWLVLCDDDTFFPSLPSLATHLTSTYNANTPLVIAAISDDLGLVYTYGLSPAGGGGIFISIPLAALLLQPTTWSSCTAKRNTEGDELLNDCLNDFTNVRPTFDPLLHQMDLYSADGGRPEAGYFESGKRMLSVHHWKTWFHYDVAAGSAVAKATGDEGVFQRWLFDRGVVLSNGYSVVDYPQRANGCLRPGCESKGGITEEELREVEYTWNEGDWGERWRYVHMMGPLRPRKTSEMKRSAWLVDTREIEAPEGRGMRQIYVERLEKQDPGENHVGWGNEERVVELLWLI